MFGPQIRRVDLENQSELRIKVQRTSPLRLRLLDGKAEIFGYELPHEAWITFPPLMTFAVCFKIVSTAKFILWPCGLD